ncbi:MAG: hypothetical protein AB1304_07765 [Bacteroidota bacterium]
MIADKYFIGVTHGEVFNNLYVTPNTIQGYFQSLTNYFNIFNFQNNIKGTKITCIKGGIGPIENNHFHFGLLIGTNNAVDNYSGNKNLKSNIAIEIDTKYNFTKNIQWNFNISKSTVQDGNFSHESIDAGIKEIFSKYRSYAINNGIQVYLNKCKTKISILYRLIDPFFKSYGLGFIRSDNIRYELKLEQKVGKRIDWISSFKKMGCFG